MARRIQRPRITVVEDEGDIREILEYTLSREGFDVDSAADGSSDLEMIRREPPDLVRLTSSSEDIHIDVTDNGPGIPPAEHGRIFERFYRSGKARSRKLGGTGLGLVIVRHVMAVLEGRAELESKRARAAASVSCSTGSAESDGPEDEPGPSDP